MRPRFRADNTALVARRRLLHAPWVVVRPASELSPVAVAEIQGLYGAFSFPEKLLQKIWLRGDFDRARAGTADGRRVRIRHPGKWNLLGGPDFHGARVAFADGPEITGDVEVHLRAADWDAHAHARDRAYDGVVLHVVLFPPEPGRVTRGADGREIPMLALLPLLHHDLEEYAADEAVERLANRALARVPEELGLLPPGELTALLRRQAEARWRQKVYFARLRLQRLGWEAACHHSALEILGYRFNRAPMLRIAAQWPLAEWERGAASPETIFADEAAIDGWSLQGVRPANHPRVRLRQYAAWTRNPGWTARLVALAGAALVSNSVGERASESSTRDVRRQQGFAKLRDSFAREICGEAMGGTRLDTLVCDGFLPLLAAYQGERADGGAALWQLWFHWFAGDLPPILTSGLRQLGVFDGRAQPACHGIAQGLLGWLLEREARA